MSDSTGSEPAAELVADSRQLYVEFDIEPGPESTCPLGGFSGAVEEVRQQFVDGECHTDTAIFVEDCNCSPEVDCTEVVHTASDVDTACPCAVFAEFDCVPKLTDVDGGRVTIETYLTDRGRLADLVEALRGVSASLSLRRLKRIGSIEDDSPAETVTLDLQEVTAKQREAAVEAVTAGYYETPRETTLEALAAELDISKSALSQRLTAVESKLATAVFATAPDDD